LAGAAALAVAGRVLGQPPPVTWRPATQSPRAVTPGPQLATLAGACGMLDGALAEVAARTAKHQADGGALLRAHELASHRRAAGDPHVGPRAWSIAGAGLDEEDIGKRVRAWIAPWNTLGVRRCGIARVAGDGGNTVVAVVAVDALADIAPLPTTARV